MRVGIFDPYLDDIGGGEKYMMTIASVLSSKYDVDIFWDNSHDLQLVSERFGINTSRFRLVKNIFRPEVSSLQRFLATQKYHAIVFLSDGSIPLVGSKKLYVHIQQPLEHIQGSLVGKLKLARVTKFFCNSLYTQNFIAKKFGLSSDVIYPPVALHPKHVEKENIIVHVGRFRVKNVKNGDYKKQGAMIQAFKDMVDKGLKNWKFVLAVSFSEKEQGAFDAMKKTTQGYPIEFLINQQNAKLWDVYSKAKIYWHASGYGEDLVAHPEYAEHFGISTVEAMGAGAVPVVINAGGQKEIVQEGINGLFWNTLDELEEKTQRLIKNPKTLEDMAVSAKKTAEKFSDKAFAEKILGLVR